MKKTMKIIFGIVLALMVYWLNAQQGERQKPRHPSPEKMLEKATKELDLADDQVKAWQEVHEEFAEDMENNPRQTIPKIEAEIKGILSEEQWKKFEEMKPKKSPRGREGG